MGHTAFGGAVEDHGACRGVQLVQESVAEPEYVLPVSFRLLVGQVECGGEAYGKSYRFGSGASPLLLMSAPQLRRELRVSAHEQSTDAFRAMKLVRAEG